ncbi:hypothetical protein BG004_007552 [Podila humilis]|nr:hypothetical protein BG004_007552 [Podila humilis]
MAPKNLQFRVVPPSDIPQAYAIELDVYPEGEPATLETIQRRQAAASQLMFGCYDDDDNDGGDSTTTTRTHLVGYIIATRANDDHLTHESMYAHDPTGKAVCIHSVAVAASYHRQGVATKLLREYLAHLEQYHHHHHHRHQQEGAGTEAGAGAGGRGEEGVDRVLLIAHKELMGLYAKVGFQEVGISDVVHGPDPWYEMVYFFP